MHNYKRINKRIEQKKGHIVFVVMLIAVKIDGCCTEVEAVRFTTVISMTQGT